MGSDISGTYLRGFGKPFALSVDNLIGIGATYGASFTQASPTVGEALPYTADIAQRLRTGGSQSDGGDLTIQTLQVRPSPGRFGWRTTLPAVSGEDYRGQDAPVPVGWKSIFSTLSGSSYTAVRSPHAAAWHRTGATTGDGQVVCAANTSVTGTLGRVDVAVYTPSTDTWSSAANLYGGAILGDGQWPCVAVDPRTGYVYIAHWITDTTASLTGIRVHRGIYNGSSWAWAVHSSQAADVQIDTSSTVGSGNDGYDLGRLRLAINPNGEFLIVGALVQHDNNTGVASYINALVQYASSDGGASFRQVALGRTTSATPLPLAFDHDLLVVDGKFVIAGFVEDASAINSIVTIELPHAGASVVERINTFDLVQQGPGYFALPGGSLVFDGTPSANGGQISLNRSAIWLDEDGETMYAAAVCESGTYADHLIILISEDKGRTWRFTGDGDRLGTQFASATASDSGGSAQYHASICGISTYGRQLLFTQEVAGSSTTDVIAMIPLGGSTTVNLPASLENPALYQRKNWDYTYFPLRDFTSLTQIAGTGSATVAAVATGLNVVNSAGTKYWTDTITTTHALGAVVMVEYTPTSGGTTSTNGRSLAIEITDNSTTSYKITLRMAPTQFTVFDNEAAANVATSVAKSGGTRTQILVAVANGKVSCWERDASTGHDREWVEVCSGEALTAETGSPAATSTIEWGHRSTVTATTVWGPLFHMENTALIGALSSGFSNPGDLFGRRYAGRGASVLVNDGVRLGTLDGNPSQGDTYTISADAEYPLRRVIHAISPTPRVTWRSAADNAQEVIPLRLNPSESSPTRQGRLTSDVIYVLLRNINFHDFDIDYYDGSSWVQFASVDTRLRVDNTRLRNGFIYLDTTGTNTQSNKVHIHHDEYAGCNVTHGGALLKIVTHSEGVLDNATDHKLPVFQVLGDDGTAGIGGLTLNIIPKDVLVVINTGGVAFNALRIDIAAQQTYDDHYRIGSLEVGAVHPFGEQYGWGRVVEGVPGTVTDDAPDGVRRGADLQPGRRMVRFGWTAAMEQSDLQGQAPDPDYLTASDQSGNGPVAAANDVPWSLMYMLLQHGAAKPLVYIPSLKQSTGAASSTSTPSTTGEEVAVLVRRNDFVHIYADSTFQAETVLGNEQRGRESGTPQGELVRGSTIVGREII
jgi:hypothetical protein